MPFFDLFLFLFFVTSQVLGQSNSAYCIGDNFDVIHSVFPENESIPVTSSDRIEFLRGILQKARHDHGLKFFGDIVIPQVGMDSALVRSNPDACYSLHACPYLRPAFVLDIGIRTFFEPRAGQLTSEGAVDALVEEFRTTTYQELRLWEYYALNVDRELARLDDVTNDVITPFPLPQNFSDIAAKIVQTAVVDAAWPRWPKAVRPDVAAAFRGDRDGYMRALNDANVQLYAEYDRDTAAVMEHLRGGLKYEFLAAGGTHAVPRYFCLIAPQRAEDVDVLDNNALSSAVAIANHGWVMNGAADFDYAGPASKAYLRREVIPWCDTAKLRYGACRADNPTLWDYMARYVRLMAGLVDGFRLDNCHSIPIPILRYLLAHARSVNPRLLVFAELFSSMEHKLEYVAACGIDALVREIGKDASSFDEYARTLTETSGEWYSAVLAAPEQFPIPESVAADTRAYVPADAPVIDWAYDQTHDNRPLAELRGPRDVSALAAALAMCKTPVGSMRGVDELYPREVNVVHERRRFYPYDSDEELPGIMRARTVYNKLHADLAKKGYTGVSVERFPGNGGVVPALIITRTNPNTLDKVVLIALSALHDNYNNNSNNDSIINGTTLDISGSFEKILFYSAMTYVNVIEGEKGFPINTPYLKGISCTVDLVESPAPAAIASHVSVSGSEDTTSLLFRDFTPGSVLCIKLTAGHRTKAAWARGAELSSQSVASRALEGVGLCDMNALLYRCPSEERDERPGDVYGVPGYGDLVFHGLQGWMDALAAALVPPVVSAGHPVVRNIADGLWAAENMRARIEGVPALRPLAKGFLTELHKSLAELPAHSTLRFRVFADAVAALYNAAVGKCFAVMSPFVRSGSPFVRTLALGSVMFYGRFEKAPLVCPDLLPPAIAQDFVPSLAAGFDHFCVGYMRSWGRDTTIALPGLLFTTGRFE